MYKSADLWRVLWEGERGDINCIGISINHQLHCEKHKFKCAHKNSLEIKTVQRLNKRLRTLTNGAMGKRRWCACGVTAPLVEGDGATRIGQFGDTAVNSEFSWQLVLALVDVVKHFGAS